LGIRPNPQSPIPNPQSPIPNYNLNKNLNNFILLYNKNYLNIKNVKNKIKFN